MYKMFNKFYIAYSNIGNMFMYFDLFKKNAHDFVIHK